MDEIQATAASWGSWIGKNLSVAGEVIVKKTEEVGESLEKAAEKAAK